MKKLDALNWLESRGINRKYAEERIRTSLRNAGMSYQSLSVALAEKESIKITPYGYRKYTTGQYVPNKYRNNFGWKNTYYQPAQIEISFIKED